MKFWKLLAAAAALGPGQAWGQEQCFAPEWRKVSDPVAGATYDMASEPTRSYFISADTGLPSASTTEMGREGDEVRGRCSSFSATVMNLGDKHIADPKGFFDADQARAIAGLQEGKIVSSRSLTVGGYPAREYQYSFTVDYLLTPARHKVLLVARDNQLLTFTSVWGDAGPPPADSDRSFASIRLTQAGDPSHMASFGMLQETILFYWMFPSPGDRVGIHFTPALRARLDATRTADGAAMRAFGHPREIQFLRQAGTSKVIRIQHDAAVVDWTITDDGKAISAISWEKR
ncbi:MAG: hypothetical protein J0H88_22230 [Sphingomonadales bacterium]|nr:hypothetical protein [Sphingomonadales bacterium]